MITENQFDMVFDCQQVFKALMNALARPGKIFSISENAEKIGEKNAPLIAAGLTLLDNWKKFFVCDAPQLQEKLHEMSYGQPGTVAEADYIFMPKESTSLSVCRQILSQAKIGTLAEPHKSAAVFVMTDSLEGGEERELSGPGIDGTIRITLPDEGRMWIEERQKMEFEFPCGLELYFVTPKGDLMGVPRKTRIGGVSKWDM